MKNKSGPAQKDYAEPPRSCPRQDSNLQPLTCEVSALSVELRGHPRKIKGHHKVIFSEINMVDNFETVNSSAIFFLLAKSVIENIHRVTKQKPRKILRGFCVVQSLKILQSVLKSYQLHHKICMY